METVHFTPLSPTMIEIPDTVYRRVNSEKFYHEKTVIFPRNPLRQKVHNRIH